MILSQMNISCFETEFGAFDTNGSIVSILDCPQVYTLWVYIQYLEGNETDNKYIGQVDLHSK